MKTSNEIVITNLTMKEQTVQVYFEVDLHTVTVGVRGTYFINSNGFYPQEVQGEDIETFCAENDFDEYELTLALQNIFENR